MTRLSYVTPGSRPRYGRGHKKAPCLRAIIVFQGLNHASESSVNRCKTCLEALADAEEFAVDALNRHLVDSHSLKEGR